MSTLGLRIAAALEQFWVLIDPAEGMRWYERLFAATEAEDVPLEIRADSMRAYGSSTDIAGFQEEAGRRYAESLALYEELGDEHGRAVLLHRLSLYAMRMRGSSARRASSSARAMRSTSGKGTRGA